jgi:hypothetical protein
MGVEIAGRGAHVSSSPPPWPSPLKGEGIGSDITGLYMFQLKEFVKALPRALLTLSLVAAGLLAIFVAWWIAVMGVIGLAIYLGVRRLLARGKPATGPEVIEGESRRIDEPPERLR